MGQYSGVYTSRQQSQAVGSYKWPGALADGSTAAQAAVSAAAIKAAYPSKTDGVYWIDLPTVGPTQIYCIMNSAVDGGGWMMALKATRGTTFSYSSSYWTTTNTLNPSATNRSDGDAKFDTFNYFPATDMLAIWPDLSNGGDITGLTTGTIWKENNFNTGSTSTLRNWFNSVAGNNRAPTSGRIRGAQWSGGSQFTSQGGNQFYGWNFNANAGWAVRWGFAWNNETDWFSNDAGGGIGMAAGSYSAGDLISCCQDVTGFNRTARVEIYVR